MFEIPAPVLKGLSVLESRGFEAFLVGGCLRDTVMGRAPKDWDIATAASPEAVKAAFPNCKVIETGLGHGTVTVLMDGEPLEITAYRGAPDSVTEAFCALKEDLSRRDFTVNAMAYGVEQGLIDPWGGLGDLRDRRIRCVGVPGERFAEDGLRILRGLRFAATIGFAIDADTAGAMRACKGLLGDVAGERLREEMTKLLCAGDAAAVLLDYADILAAFLPEILPLFGFEQHNKHHCFDVWRHTVAVVANVPPQPVLRWAALFHDIAKPACFFRGDDGVGHFHGHAAAGVALAERIMARLKFDNATRERVALLVKVHDTPLRPEEKAVKRLLNRLGAAAFRQLIILARADNLAQAPAYHSRQRDFDSVEEIIAKILAAQDCFSLKYLAVSGDDLLALGYCGVEVGTKLQLLLNAVIDGQVINERGALMDYLNTEGER